MSLNVTTAEAPSLGQATKVWLRIGCLGFGGPAGQIALMYRELVEERRWVSEGQFLHALNYCMLLPGPEAQQLATYVGWLLNGTIGGLVAGTLFVLPGLAVILSLAVLHTLFQGTTWLAGLFFGLEAAVLAIVVHAVLRMAKKALRAPWAVWTAIAAFLALALLAVPFPLVVLAAALVGFAIGRRAPVGGLHAVPDEKTVAGPAPTRSAEMRRIGGVLLLWGGLWLVPIVVLAGALGWSHTLTTMAVFFSKMAVVTFGGAYVCWAGWRSRRWSISDG